MGFRDMNLVKPRNLLGSFSMLAFAVGCARPTKSTEKDLVLPKFDSKTEIVFVQDGSGESDKCAVVVPARFRAKHGKLVDGKLFSRDQILSSNKGEEIMVAWYENASPYISEPIANAQVRYIASGSRKIQLGSLAGSLRIDDFSNISRKIIKPINVQVGLTDGSKVLIISYSGSISAAQASSLTLKILYTFTK